jgi:hypothetical protein
MSTGAIVAIIVVVIIVAAVIAVAAFAARRRRLQQRFGPEYDRAVEGSDSRRKAEAELAEREKRVKHLDIRELDPAARDSYTAQWTGIQEQFVDNPADAVTGAQSLITSVMNDRGYPTDDAAQIMADLSVEHASTLEHFRTAQDLSSRAAGGTASTEDLRQAMVHYRSLFRELLGDPAEGAVAADMAPADVAAADVAPADDAVAADEVPGDYAARADGAVAADEVPGDYAARADAVPVDETVPEDASAPVDAVPADDATPAASVPAADEPASAYPDSTDDPEADRADETPAASGRRPWRR